jgi:hypothetical protein
MATTALDILLEDLKFSAKDASLTRLLLGSTPLAVTGQETMVPLADIATVIKGGRMNAQNALSRLAGSMRQIDVPTAGKDVKATTLFFSVLSSVAIANGSPFVQYVINQEFLIALNAIMKTYRLKALF